MNLDKLRDWIIPQRAKAPEPILPGLYHYQRQAEGVITRFHLRVEPDGRGLLLANAAAAARLSPPGVMMAKGLLDECEEQAILADVKSRFRGAGEEVMRRDLERVAGIIRGLAAPEDNAPVLNLDENSLTVFESQYLAPLEATLPLAPPAQMRPILDRLWQIGVPHVTIFAPPQPDADHLVQAVERAEDLGMIAGVRGRATDLAAPGLLAGLAQVGVDHLTMLLAAADTAVHDALCGVGDYDTAVRLMAEVQAQEVYPMAEIPLVEATVPWLENSLVAWQQAGIHTFSFFAIVAPDEMGDEARAGALKAQAMPQTAAWVEEISNQADVRFIWQPPVQRQPGMSLADQVRAGPRTTGDVSVRVEPDGRVIPARGPYESAGDLLKSSWEQIWGNAAFTRYRERVAAPTRCIDCPGLVICAADCPREAAGWAVPPATGAGSG